MTDIELAREYYELCKPLLREKIPDVLDIAAVGLAGMGGDSFGFYPGDSAAPGFCIWLPEEILNRESVRIAKAMADLPGEFLGRPVKMHGNTGPMSITAFYKFYTNLDRAPENWQEWITLREENLACATNGEVFEDGGGDFSSWRQKLLDFYPRDVWLRKIAARCLGMAQAGQHNLPLSLKRNDGAAAMLACARFAAASLSFVFLINRRYMPFYPGAPRLCRDLPILGRDLAGLLDTLAVHPLRGARDLGLAEFVEDFCGSCASHLRAMGLSDQPDSWLFAHASSIMAHVRNKEIPGLEPFFLAENDF